MSKANSFKFAVILALAVGGYTLRDGACDQQTVADATRTASRIERDLDQARRGLERESTRVLDQQRHAPTGALPVEPQAPADTIGAPTSPPATGAYPAQPAPANSLRLAAWNLESGDADIDVMMRWMAETDDIVLWGLSEVSERWEPTIVRAASVGQGAPYASALGTTGGNDRLAIVYDTERFTLHESEELHDINEAVGGRVRSPLVADLTDTLTGERFLFVVNHLYRSRENGRHTQARMLRAWAAEQTLPVIMAGDFNFDWDVEGGDTRHDEGYDLLTAEDTMRWSRPAEIIRTQCGSARYHSVLDFVFTGGAARDWPYTSEIMTVDPAFCADDGSDTETGSDHRPVVVTYTPGG